MSRAYYEIAFTPAVRAMQTRMGSRSTYAPLDHTEGGRDALTADEAAFIHERDGFYQASVSESGWPYVQFRGGPAGFLKVLDGKTIGYADFRGNVQYITVGNLQGNDRVALMLMDYANQRRLKILGRARLVDRNDDPALLARLEIPNYRARTSRRGSPRPRSTSASRRCMKKSRGCGRHSVQLRQPKGPSNWVTAHWHCASAAFASLLPGCARTSCAPLMVPTCPRLQPARISTCRSG